MNLFKISVSALVVFLYSVSLFSQESSSYLSLSVKTQKYANQPLNGSTVRINGKHGFKKELMTSSAGSVSMNLPLNEEYQIILSHDGFENISLYVSTLVPPSQAKLIHSFNAPIIFTMNAIVPGSSVEIKSSAEIVFDEKKKSFTYNSRSLKSMKDINYSENSATQKVPENKENKPAAPAPEKAKSEEPPKQALEKAKSEAELKAMQIEQQKKQAEDAKAINKVREDKQVVSSDIAKSSVMNEATQKEEKIIPKNAEELLQKRSADYFVDEAIKTGMGVKSTRQKNNLQHLDKQEEINSNRKKKYERNNPYTEMMNSIRNSKN